MIGVGSPVGRFVVGALADRLGRAHAGDGAGLAGAGLVRWWAARATVPAAFALWMG